MFKYFLVALLFFSNNLYAQNNFYVPFAPGALTDITARTITKDLKDYIVLNKPGAGGQIAIEEMHQKPGILISHSSLIYVGNKLIYKEKLKYDLDELEVLATVALTPGLLMCNKNKNIKTINELLNYPNSLNFGVAVRGGVEHFNTEILLEKTKVKHQQVFYSVGGTKHLQDLIGGHVDCVFGNLTSMLGILENTNLIPILVTHENIELLKVIPTWKSVFHVEFPLENVIILITDKKINSILKKKYLDDISVVLNAPTFQKEIVAKGNIPYIKFGPSAQKIIDKYNMNLMKFLISNNIKLTD